MSAFRIPAIAFAAALIAVAPMEASAQGAGRDDPAASSSERPRWRGPGMTGPRGMERGWRHHRQAGQEGYGSMRGQMMHGRMMGMGMMGLSGREMMMILMDTDGDGSVSRQEFLDAHGRIFDYLDRDGDGRLGADEMFRRRAWPGEADDAPTEEPDTEQ